MPQDISTFTPEQMAEILRQEKVAVALNKKVLNLLNAHQATPNAALAALAAVSGVVMQHIPPEHRKNFFMGFQTAVRDAAFGQNSVAVPMSPPPPDLKPKL
jgi:hypothetical protein